MNYVFGELSTTLTISKSSFFKLKGVSEKQNNLSPQNLLIKEKNVKYQMLIQGEGKQRQNGCLCALRSLVTQRSHL